MFKIPLNEIIDKIKEATGLSEKDIEKKIDEKMLSLDGLVSKEGAAHIIAHEFGVEIFKSVIKKKIKINEIVIGLRQFEITGKITKIFEIREFRKKTGQGKVGSFILADETGSIRVTLWNDMTKLIESGKIEEGKVIQIKDGLIKSNEYQGRESKEIHTSIKTKISFDIEENIEVKETGSASINYVQKKIENIKEGDFVKIRGTLVSIYAPRTYEICPECSKKINFDGEKYICNDHGEKTPKKAALFSFILDDGTENIRCVCFKETAESILNISAEEIDASKEEDIKNYLNGNEIEIVGRVKENKQISKNEILVSGINNNLKAVSIAKNILGEK